MKRVEFSKRIKLDGWQRANGRCENCGIKLATTNVEFHHKTECTMAGEATLDNLQVLCQNCHSAITRSRAAVIAKSNRVRAAHLGIKRTSSRPMPGSRNSRLKKHMDGSVSIRS